KMQSARPYNLCQQTVCIKSISFRTKSIVGYTELLLQPLTPQLRKVKLNCKQCTVYSIWLETLPDSRGHQQTAMEASFAFNDPTMEICRAEMKQRNLAFFEQRHELAVGSVDPDSNNGEILVPLPQDLWPAVSQGRQLRITVEFSLQQPQAGLYFCSPLGEDGEVDMRSAHCFTSATGNSTRLWLPCIDSCSELCQWRLEITVPEDMVAVAPGDLLETVYTQDLQSKTYRYFLAQPTCAPNIGFAIGAFELETGPPLSGATASYFCPPPLVSLMKHTVSRLPDCLAFYESLLGVRLPYGSLKLVFVDQAYETVQSYASVILASVSLLHSARIVDQAIESRRALALALAQQFFGCYIGMQTFSDAWLPQGISGHIAALYQRKVFGHNEYRNYISDQMSQVCHYESTRHEVLLDPSGAAGPDKQSAVTPFCLRFPQTVPPDYAAIYRSKAMLVIRLLGCKLGEEVLQYVLNKLITLASSYDPSLQQQPLQPGTEQSWRPAFLLSSQALLDLILALTGKNMQYLLDQWVTQPGHARLRASFSINKKRNLIALEIRDDPPVAASGGGGGGGGRRRRYTGAVAVSLQELDGPFTHTLKLDESAAVSDLPCHTKSRKIKRRKVLLSNGDELEDPDLGKLESDCSLLWLRVDPEMQLIRHVEIVQPEPMWHLLLRYERCVASQMAACRALCQPCFHSRETWQALMEVVRDERQYYRVRMQACYALCMISGPLDLLEPLMAVFLSLFGAKDTRSVTPANDFSNLQRYFLLKEVPLCMSLLHTAQGVCPPEVPEFILNLLRFNDNSKNIYADDYYRAALIESLFRTVSPAATVTTENFLAKLPKPIAALLEEVTRHMNLEKLMPSYRMVVTVKCLRVFRKLQRTGYIPADIGIFKSYAAPGNYIDVRLAAMEAVVNHIKCAKDAAALAWLLDSTVCNPAEEASVRHQAVAMLTIQPPFLRRKRGQLDTPELVERLWRLLNTELSADCRLRCSVASLYHLLYGRHRPKCTPLPENFLVLNVREGRTKIAQRAPTPTPAPADTDDDNANFGLTGAGVGLGSSGDEADVDDDLDIGLEDDYEFAPDEPPIDEADFVWPPDSSFPAADAAAPAAPAVAAAAAAATPALDEEMLDDGDRDAAEDDEDEIFGYSWDNLPDC
ncbi:hypothetical protein BOX15_Mlig007954g1, partial [Macrostomum lignano]